jgi:hypothetical protein
MNNKSKKILIGIMAIVMQTSVGTSIFAASPIRNYPQMQKYEEDGPSSDRGEDEHHRHGDERRHREEERHHQEEEENRRHNEAMRRHHMKMSRIGMNVSVSKMSVMKIQCDESHMIF